MKVTGQEKLLVDGGRRRRVAPALRLEPARSRPRSAACRSSSTSRRTWPRRKAYAAPLSPRRDGEARGSSWPAGKVVLEQFFAHHHDGGFAWRVAGRVAGDTRRARQSRRRLAAARAGSGFRPPRLQRRAAPNATSERPARRRRDRSHGREPDAVHGAAPPGRGADRHESGERQERERRAAHHRRVKGSSELRHEEDPQRRHRVAPEQHAGTAAACSSRSAERQAVPALVPARSPGSRLSAPRARSHDAVDHAAEGGEPVRLLRRPARHRGRARARRRGRRGPSARAPRASSLSAVSDGWW